MRGIGVGVGTSLQTEKAFRLGVSAAAVGELAALVLEECILLNAAGLNFAGDCLAGVSHEFEERSRRYRAAHRAWRQGV